MAAPKKRTRRIIEEDVPDDEATETQDSATAAAQEEAERRMTEREPTATIRRSDPLTGKLTFLDTVAAALVTEDWLADNYGGGKYIAYKRGLKDGKWQYVGSETFEIDDSIPFKGSLKAQRKLPPMGGGFGDDDELPRVYERDGRAVGGGGGDSLIQAGVFNLIKAQADTSSMSNQFFMTMMQQMSESSRTHATMMMEMMKANKPAGMDIPALISAIASLAPLLQPLLNRKELSPQDIIELIREARPKAEGEKLSEMLEIVSKMREAFAADGGGGGSGDGFMGALSKALDVLPSLVQARTMAGNPPPSAAPRAAASASPEPTVPRALLELPRGDEALVVTKAEDVWALMEPYIPRLHLAAATGRNPGRIAVTVWEFAPANYQAVLTEVLADEGFEDALLARFPTLAAHKVWTYKFVEGLRGEAFADEDADDEPEGGDDADAPSAAKDLKDSTQK